MTDYKKMNGNGSLESIEKSVLSSEASFEPYDPSNFSGTEDYNTMLTQNYQKPEAQPRTKVYGLPEYNGQGFELAYRNEGFKDNSVYSGDRQNSVGTNLNDDSTPIIHHTDAEDSSDYYGNSSTLPMRDQNLSFLTELKNRLPEYDSGPRSTSTQSSFLPPPPDPPQPQRAAPKTPPKYAVPELRRPGPAANAVLPPVVNRPDSYYKATRGLRDSTQVHRPRTLYEAAEEPAASQPKKSNYSRSKSEALLETNFDDGAPPPLALSPDSRSHSQPLETAM